MQDFKWYLVQFKPNSHRIAERNLLRQGFDVFLPMQKITKRNATRFVHELRPVFPGYLFVHLCASAGPWRTVNATYGVSKLVSFSKIPAPVPDDFIDGLISRCDQDAVLKADGDMCPGDQVIINQGPFSNFLATIQDIQDDERVWILLDLLGQKSKINVPKSNLQLT